MFRAWPNTLLALTGALGPAQMGKNGKILGLKDQLKIRKKFGNFFLNFWVLNGLKNEKVNYFYTKKKDL